MSKSQWKVFENNDFVGKIAEKCGHKQSWVSKVLKENLLIENIVLKTAIELKNYPDFKNLKKDPEALNNVLNLLKKNICAKEKSLLKTLINENIKSWKLKLINKRMI